MRHTVIAAAGVVGVVLAALPPVGCKPRCEEPGQPPDPGTATVVPPAAAAPGPTAAPAPASASPAAAPAGAVEYALSAVGNTMAYSVTSMTAKTRQKVHVVLRNPSTLKVMSHNWVLVRPGTEAKVAEAGLGAGEKNDYLALPNPDVLASTKLAGPGETVEVTFTAPAPGTYPYICTMPGHYVVMKGTFVVTP